MEFHSNFIIVFWDRIINNLLLVFDKILLNGELAYSQRLSVISLIYKDSDAENIANYRPKCLTTVDYKILAFVLAERVQKLLPNIIEPDQTGYVKGRFIGTNIRTVEDIICHSDK
jgi:hypothetical protein